MDLHLENKVVMITGGASGIGEATVHSFVAEGAIPVIVDLNAEKGEKLSAKLTEAGHKNLFVQTNLMDESLCKKAVDKTVETFGSIDVLFNNAGMNDSVGIDQPTENFIKSLQKNLHHYFTMTHFCHEYLKKSKGNIINIASKVAMTGQGGTSGYAASKGGIVALTREWAVDFAKDGIRVNAVIPAEVFTPLYATWIQTFDNPDQKLAEISANIPLGKRMTTSEEIADTSVFIASNRSAHTTGQLLSVDGGYMHLDRAMI